VILCGGFLTRRALSLPTSVQIHLCEVARGQKAGNGDPLSHSSGVSEADAGT
jgi:hypothetical protein